MPVVQVPGQGNVQFPDSMSDDDISRAIRMNTDEPAAKGSPDWVQWRTQRAHDIVDAATAHNAPEDKGFLHGLWQSVNPFPAIGQVLMGRDPKTGTPAGPIQGIQNLASNAIDAGIDQAKKARDAFTNGDYVSAGGHGLAAALPLVGPAAANAGDAIGDGRTGEGLGQATGLVGSMLAPGAVAKTAGVVDRIAPGLRPAVSDYLKADAAKEYGQALAPTKTGNKIRTAEVVPELIDRGVSAFSLKGLAKRAQSEISSVGQAIGDEWANLPPGTSTDFQPIYDRLQKEIEDTHSIKDASGKPIPKGPQAEIAIGNINKLQQTLTDIAETDPATGKLVIPVDKLRSLRQYWDDVAAKAGRYDGKTLAEQSTAEAHGIAADAIREELGKQFPSIDALNKEYSFWKNVNQVVSDTILRKQGQGASLGSKLVKGGAQVVGATQAGWHGAILAGEMASKLENVMTSPAWRTVSAVMKDRLADAIASGNTGAVGFYAGKIIQAAGTETSLLDSAPDARDTLSPEMKLKAAQLQAATH